MINENRLYADIPKSYVSNIVEDKTGNSVPIHFHSLYELYYLYEGKREYLIDGKIYTANVGSIVVIKPGVLHETSGSAFKRHLIHFNRSLLLHVFTESYVNNMLDKIPSGVFSVNEDYKSRIEMIFKESQKYCEENDVENFCLSVANILSTVHLQKKLEVTDGNDGTVERLINYLGEHYSENYSLDKIAKDLYVSKFYLCHTVKKQKNTTVTKLLNKIRIEKAAELLRLTCDKVKDIYIECGFNSEYYFNKLFKTETGYTPLSYRKLFT